MNIDVAKWSEKSGRKEKKTSPSPTDKQRGRSVTTRGLRKESGRARKGWGRALRDTIRLIGGRGGTEVRYIEKKGMTRKPPNAVSSITHLPRGRHESPRRLCWSPTQPSLIDLHPAVPVIVSYGYSSYKSRQPSVPYAHL